MTNNSRSFTFGGGILGLCAYLTIGLLPSIVYGGFAGVTLASSILGQTIVPGLAAKGLVVLGMVTGLLGTAALFVVIGSALGAGLYAAAHVITPAFSKISIK